MMVMVMMIMTMTMTRLKYVVKVEKTSISIDDNQLIDTRKPDQMFIVRVAFCCLLLFEKMLQRSRLLKFTKFDHDPPSAKTKNMESCILVKKTKTIAAFEPSHGKNNGMT